jgi:NhaP-type Na+/H+ or K+/H+ antiporter
MEMLWHALAVLGNYALGILLLLFCLELFTGVITGAVLHYLFKKYPDTFPLYKPLLRWIRRKPRP